MFYGSLLLFIAGAMTSYNIAGSFIALVVISTGMHIITIRADKKKRGFEHFTSFFLGVMAGILVLGSLILPYLGVYPTSSLVSAVQKQEFVWSLSL